MFFHRIRKLLSALAAVSIIALIAGCGGGGGSTSSEPPAPQTPTPQTPPDRPINLAAERNQDEIGDAARNEPAPGSVTQSTNRTEARTRVTADRVQVEWSRESGRNRYVVTNTASGQVIWRIDTGSEPSTVVTRDRLPAAGDEDGDDTNNRGAEFGVGLRKRLDDGTLLLHVIRFPQSFDLSELEDASADYLSAGLWAYVPTDDSEDISLGTFADGDDGFHNQNLRGLEGVARYVADNGAFGLFSATGIEDEADLPSIGSFFADVDLTARFGNGNELGRIEGFIFRFEDESGSDPTADDGIRIMLLPADIGANNHGFFTGETELRLTPTGNSMGEGKWGGQFFGNNGDQATDYPGAVAGTFGTHTTNPTDPGRTLSIIGAYVAPRNDNPPSTQ